MEMGDQHYAPSALPNEKESPLDRKLNGPQSGRCGVEKSLLTLLGIKSRPPIFCASLY
jgi:hypothetical protein